MNKEPLLVYLGKVRIRLSVFGLLRTTLFGLLGGSFAGALILAASRLWPLLHSRLLFVAFVIVGLAAGIGIGLWRRASMKDAARQMDRGEPQDAIMTALDGLLRETTADEGAARPVIVRLQRQEAVEAAIRYTSDLSRSLPWPSWHRWRSLVYGTTAVWVLIVVLLLVPNPLDERAAALAESKEAIEQLEQERDALEEKLEAMKLPEAEKQELLTPLDELREALEAPSVDSAKALNELEAAMKQLELAAEEAQAAAERLEAAADAMTEQPELKPLGEAVQARDAEALEGSIDELRSRLRELTPAEREALAQALERLAEQQPQDGAAGELSAALEQAAQQARAAGDPAAESGAAEVGSDGDGLAALEEALARGLTQGELEALARSAAGQLGASGRQLAEQLAAQGGAVPPAWAAGGGSEAGQGSGSGAGQGSGSEAGQGSGGEAGQGSGGEAGQGGGGEAGQGGGGGAGQGSGSGAGQGSGSGAGQGSGSGAGQGSGSGAGGSGAGTGAGGRHLVTTPRSMQGTGPVENDGGPSTGGKTQTGGQSPMIDGTTRPYEEVYSEYAAEAKKSLGRSQLPASMQEKVKQYFDQIQPD
ncbi:hypothetical protein RB620_06825 [Paenibacillus sp. LHD-117]|uniref:hypothetical protein n=1 Tax=Paenibacillus sp. LHD-117 TaxID=3071412 RepID=UPI0027DF6913|nr:hypothetical protein [Paenibacillus sp. LHD-117]MDQ6419151.1 hypothetical protein [Paenibacillus sp. LHD-117]